MKNYTKMENYKHSLQKIEINIVTSKKIVINTILILNFEN